MPSRFAIPVLIAMLLIPAALPVPASADGSGYAGWMQQGRDLAAQGQWDEAVQAFRAAIFQRPYLATPHDELARIYLAQNDLASAVTELETSLQLERHSSAAPHMTLVEQAYRQAQTNGQAELTARLERMMPEHASPTAPSSPSPAEAEAALAMQQVRQALETWRKAWSARDVETYLAAYAPTFDPGERFPSLKAWQDYKRNIIARQASIEVSIEGLEIFPRPDGSFRAVFMQRYRTPGYASDDLKVLWFDKAGEDWLISREISG